MDSPEIGWLLVVKIGETKPSTRGGGGGIQRSMAVVLAVPAKKENGNLGVCLIMATDMAQI